MRSGRIRWTVVAGLAAVLLAAGVALALSWRPAIAEVAPPTPASFAPDAIRRGEALSQVGDCHVCHTAAGGAAFAGGRAIRTPFGVVYASNITPDADTGIGRWSLPAFDRALRRGVSRNGAHLYPAFPYTHYAGLTEAEVRDLYAYQMTRPAVRAETPAPRLIPPLGFRPVLAGWKLLFFHPRPAPPDPGRGAEWARGRHLAEALSHCNACHGPRNVLGAEEKGRPYAGGWSDGWYAPPLDASSPAVRAWTPDRMYDYLRTGLSLTHAAAAGPMGEVARGLSSAPDADVRALAVYASSLMAQAPASHRELPARDRADLATHVHPEGAMLYAGACATCHEPGAGMMREGRPPLPLGTPLHERNGRDVVQIVLQGLQPPVGRAGPYMPAFRESLTDAQVAEIAAYLRARHGSGPPWPDLKREVAKARREGEAS